jgi:hypothetical protein
MLIELTLNHTVTIMFSPYLSSESGMDNHAVMVGEPTINK